MATCDETRKVPRRALQFAGGKCEFGASADGDGKIPVSLVARSAQPITHWYWGRIVHDIAGMQPAGDSIPLDYVHSDSEVIGYGDEFDTSGDLVVKGALVPFGECDRVAEITHKAALGVPYQASIFFDPDDMILEEVPGGKSVEVNGYTFDGPGLVVREWTLRGVAICPYGADKNTSVQFAAGETVEVKYKKEANMAKRKKPAQLTDEQVNETNEPAADPADEPTTKETEPATEPAAEPADEPATENEPAAEPDRTQDADTATSPPSAAGEQAAKTGKDFIAAFGEKGAVWFVEGKSWDEAQRDHAAELQAENTELKKKLEAVEFGQTDAVSFDAADETSDESEPKLKPQLGGNLARFAAGIKLPTPSAN